jgi:hypothetical protein
MDDDELALYFAAKKENEELKAKLKDHEELKLKISRLETNLNSVVVEAGKAELYRRSLDNDIIDRDQSIDKMLSFINLLDDYPMFWGASYKRSIRQFLDINFPEK